MSQWLSDTWAFVTEYAAELIDVAIALGTFALAAATFRLARHAGQTARDGRAALAVFTKQAEASDRLAKTAQESLVQQRELGLRQLRTHVVWLDSGQTDNSVTQDPIDWPSDKPESRFAVRVDAKVKNVSAIPAFLEKVDHPSIVRTVIIDPQTISGGAEANVTIYVPIEIGKPMELPPSDLRLHYKSVASGEGFASDAILHIWVTVKPIERGGVLITSRQFDISGQAFVSSSDNSPNT